MVSVTETDAVELTAPPDNLVFQVRAIRSGHVDTDPEAATRLVGLITDLAALDPVWSGSWKVHLPSSTQLVDLALDRLSFERMFADARDAGDMTPVASWVSFTLGTGYGAVIATNPIMTVPTGTPPRDANPTSMLRMEIRPQSSLAEAGLTSRATSATVALALFEAIQRWFEPDEFFYIPQQAWRITEAVAGLLRPLRLFRMVDKATSAYISGLPIGWLNLLPPDTRVNTRLLPDNAIVTADERTGGTIIRLGDSPWTVTDKDYLALRTALNLPNPGQIIEVRGLRSDERRAIKSPYW